MKQSIKLLISLVTVLSLCGCKNTKKTDDRVVYNASENIKYTYSYTIRKGESLALQLPYYTWADNYSEFKDKIGLEDDYVSPISFVLEVNSDCGIVFSGDYPFINISCNKEFSDTLEIKKIFLKFENDIYVSIPVNLKITYNEESYTEPPFMHDEFSTNVLYPFRVSGIFTFDSVPNLAYLKIIPKEDNLYNSKIEIDDINVFNNEYCFIEEKEYCLFLYPEDAPDEYFETVQNVTYTPMDSGVYVDDSKYTCYETLVLKITFSDTIGDNSLFTGVTLKLNIKIDGEPYTVYRSFLYYRTSHYY